MAERGRGGVINVSSVAAFLPRGTYAAAKAYVEQLQRVGGQRVPPARRHRDGAVPRLHQDRVPRADGRHRGGSGFMWLDADVLVDRGARGLRQGPIYSIPGAQYKAIVALSRLDPQPGAPAPAVHRPQVSVPTRAPHAVSRRLVCTALSSPLRVAPHCRRRRRRSRRTRAPAACSSSSATPRRAADRRRTLRAATPVHGGERPQQPPRRRLPVRRRPDARPARLRSPRSCSTSFAQECASVTFDQRGRLLTVCVGVENVDLRMLDPRPSTSWPSTRCRRAQPVVHAVHVLRRRRLLLPRPP